jgi:hypothetical protein
MDDPDENTGDEPPPGNVKQEEELDWGSGQADCFSASVTGQRGR